MTTLSYDRSIGYGIGIVDKLAKEPQELPRLRWSGYGSLKEAAPPRATASSLSKSSKGKSHVGFHLHRREIIMLFVSRC